MMGNAPERIWATMLDPDCARSGTFVDCVEYPTKPNADAIQYMPVDLAPAPRVKPLVWTAYGVACWIAPAPLFGSFRVEHYGDEKWQALWSVPGYCATFADGDFATADEAKAAIEARILAALSPPEAS